MRGIKHAILAALADGDEKTIPELQEATGFDDKQLANNLFRIRGDAHVSYRKEDGQRALIYRITAGGKQELARLNARGGDGAEQRNPDPASHPPRAPEERKAPAERKEAGVEGFGAEYRLDGTLVIWQGAEIIRFDGTRAARLIEFMGRLAG